MKSGMLPWLRGDIPDIIIRGPEYYQEVLVTFRTLSAQYCPEFLVKSKKGKLPEMLPESQTSSGTLTQIRCPGLYQRIWLMLKSVIRGHLFITPRRKERERNGYEMLLKCLKCWMKSILKWVTRGDLSIFFVNSLWNLHDASNEIFGMGTNCSCLSINSHHKTYC